jgi:putative transposase
MGIQDRYAEVFMSIDKDLLDQLMEGRAPGDLFGKTGILQELTKALAERTLSTEMEVHLSEEEAQAVLPGRNEPANRKNGTSQKTVTTDIIQRSSILNSSSTRIVCSGE